MRKGNEERERKGERRRKIRIWKKVERGGNRNEKTEKKNRKSIIYSTI